MDKDLQTQLHTDIMTAMRGLEYDVTNRNNYMRRRYDAVYADGLYRTADIDGWFAEYNLVGRVVDIYTSQLMGRGFGLTSYYTKEDLTPYEGDDNELQVMELKNKKEKANADIRQKLIASIIRDNGGMAKFEDGARIGSSMGQTVFKLYPDMKAKKVVISLLESPQNYRAGWSNDDFRERDFDAYVMQISVDSANRDYKDKIPSEATFFTSQPGNPLLDYVGAQNPLDTNANGIPSLRTGTNIAQTTRKMVTTIDFTGYLPLWGVVNGQLAQVESGKETKISVYDVGGYIVDTVTDEKHMPLYYPIANRQVPRQAWGASDISDSLIDINKEIIRIMADEMSWADKNLWKIMLGKGITEESLSKLKNKSRKTKLLSVGLDQDLTEVATTTQPLSEFARLIEQKLDLFVRIAGIGRVLFDDPTVNANSNAALLTTLKSVVDVIESKQKRWEPVLREMFTQALHMSVLIAPELKEIINSDGDWYLNVEWPSVLRREDAAYQTQWLNLFNRGAISLDTYLEKVGIPDATEEINRIRDNMKDPVMAAVMGNMLGEMAHQTLNKALGIPPWGYVIPKVQLRGELAPQEVGNMAHNFNWDQGPYGDAIGPTGMDGQIAADNFDNSGFTNGDVRDGGQAKYQGPNGQPPQAPQAAPGQPGPMSQPGSGAPAVTPGGAAAQAAQQGGK